MSVLVAVVYSRTASLLDHQLDEDIRDDLADLADVADRQGLPAAAEAIGRLLDEPERRTDAYYLLVDRDGRPLAGNAPGVPTQVGWVDMPLSTRISRTGGGRRTTSTCCAAGRGASPTGRCSTSATTCTRWGR